MYSGEDLSLETNQKIQESIKSQAEIFGEDLVQKVENLEKILELKESELEQHRTTTVEALAGKEIAEIELKKVKEVLEGENQLLIEKLQSNI